MTENGATRREGKVAQVLSERQVVINLGSRDGVRTGTRFAVLSNTPSEVRDPDTQEILGTVDLEKAKVEVVEVQERLSICATYETYSSGGWDFPTWWSLRRENPVTLDAETAPIPRPDDSYVRIGDRVRELARDPALSRSAGARV